jgi:PAS domain S-box-containing protein
MFALVLLPSVKFTNMNIVLIVSLALAFIIICTIVFSLKKKNETIADLKSKLNNQMQAINERMQLADKYSKMLADVASKTYEAVIITDKDGNIEWVNSGFEQITGYNFLDVKGKKPGSILQGPETNKETVVRIREKLKQKQTFKEDILNYHKSGKTYWLSLSITPVLDFKGNIEKFIAIESDITEQKKQVERLENELKKSN